MPVPGRDNRVSKRSAPLPKHKSIACSPCHARKIRCLGGSPCNNCTNASACVYPHRDPQVKVNQSYIDRLLQENAKLRALTNTAESQALPVEEGQDLLTPESVVTLAKDGDVHPDQQDGAPEASENPILQPEPWFTQAKASSAPIWIGEASDSAFATRLRQFAAPDPVSEVHVPRTHYATDESLAAVTSSSSPYSQDLVTLPSPSRSKFLVEVALRHICRCYHIVRRSDVMSSISMVGRGSNGDDSWSRGIECRLWALLAHGELHSTKMAAPGDMFPGLVYFAKASELLQVISERPQLEVVETMLLLSLYSLHVNRRHAAYTLVGSAVRLATVMGLHLNIGPGHIPDAATHEHRKRLWWTAYNFDRFWSCKLGLPVSIPDEDISVDLPTEIDATAANVHPEDFADIGTDHLVANVSLARLAGDIIRAIYRRGQQQDSFSQRVQGILKALRAWSEELPAGLQLNHGDNSGKPVSLHLAFNQLLILATRPVLLHVLGCHLATSRGGDATATESELPESVRAVVDACVQTARHSCLLLTECWINGSFHAYDFFYTQYLFSASTILAISAILPRRQEESPHDDIGGFLNAADFLEQLQRHGNFAAREFHAQALGIISSVLEPLGVMKPQDRGPRLQEAPATEVGAADSQRTSMALGFPYFDPVSIAPGDDVFGASSLQNLLTDESLDLSFLDNAVIDEERQEFYFRPSYL